MERLTFHLQIDAPSQTVWDVLWNDTTYPEWTAVFSPGSRAETTWQKGSKVKFVDANNEGMVATIAEKIPYEFMSFKHTGTVKNGVEDSTSQWPGSFENYSLQDSNGKTSLTVEMDVTQDYKDYFQDTWPKALEQVKQLAEQSLASKQA